MSKRIYDSSLPPIKQTENPEHIVVESAFLPAFLQDNKILQERDPGYADRLFQSGEKLAAAMLEGDWTVFAGQFLSEFKRHTHVIPPFEIPRHWTKFRGYDWGFAAPFAMAWFAKEPMVGRIYIYQEAYEYGKTDPEQAEMINDMSGSERYIYTLADPAVWTKRTTDRIAKSTYDVFLEYSILLAKAENNQERKAKKLRSFLANIHDKKPGLQVFSTCKNVIMELEGMMSNPDHPEIPLPGQADHLYDAICYGLSRVTPPKLEKKTINSNQQKSPLVGLEGT